MIARMLLIYRLIIPPLLMLLVIKVLISCGLLSSNDGMMNLIILIESAAPSAQIVIVCINQLGIPHVGSHIAFAYVFQYLCSIVTITLWTTIGISLYY